MDPSKQSLPMLLEDKSRFDWPDGSYEPDVRVGNRTTILHRIEGVPALQALVYEGKAKWATEVRCPKTLMSRTEVSDTSNQEVVWKQETVEGQIFIVPGLLAVEEFTLGADGLSPLWQDQKLDVPAGWWLAKGDARKVNPFIMSLIHFSKKDKIAPGEMRVEADKSLGRLRFVVSLAPDVYSQVRTNRSIQIAGLIAACGIFPQTIGKFEDSSEIDDPVVKELAQRLEEADVPLWIDGDYDPARAATTLEHFTFASQADNHE